MNADGSGKTRVLPASFSDTYFSAAYPSDRVYGTSPIHDRWWITLKATGYYDEYITPGGDTYYDWPHLDLFAVRTNPTDRSVLEEVQLTDLYGYAMLSQTATAHWSNDSNEASNSFVGAGAYDIRGKVFVDETWYTVIDLTGQDVFRSLRLPLTASDIQDAWTGGGFEPYGPGAMSPEEFDFLLDFVLWPNSKRGTNWTGGAESPLGDYVVINEPETNDFMIVDAAAPNFADPVVLLWDRAAGRYGEAHWSRNGQTIMMWDGFPLSGIWLQPASGATPPSRIRAYSSTRRYIDNRWSFDSNFVLLRYIKYSNGVEVGYGLERVFPTDLTGLDLVEVASPAYLTPVRWVSNTPGS
jgi:hypothetical protein